MLTARSRLRRQTDSDYNNMRSLESNPLIMCFTPSRVPQTEQQTRDRLVVQIEAQKLWAPFGIWLAEDKNTGDFLGWFMLMPIEPGTVELGFMLVQSQWNKGWATEIAGGLLEFAKAQGIGKIFAKTDVRNLPSRRVLEKLGFVFSENARTEDKVLGSVSELANYVCMF